MSPELDKNLSEASRIPQSARHPSFERLASWAETNGCLQIIQALYWVLGLEPNDTGVVNLVDEADSPESREILNSWQGVPVVQHLINLRRQMSGFPFRDYYSRLHSGSADQTKRSFSHLREKDFLLAMITNPLTDAAGGDRLGNADQQIFRLRRMLRLWLVLEALRRLERQQFAFDTNISSAARKITIGAESNSWSYIDELLGRVAKRFPNQLPAFSDFKNALTESAHQLAGETKQRDSKLFFNAIHAIGVDTSSPVDSQSLLPDIRSLHPHWGVFSYSRLILVAQQNGSVMRVSSMICRSLIVTQMILLCWTGKPYLLRLMVMKVLLKKPYLQNPSICKQQRLLTTCLGACRAHFRLRLVVFSSGLRRA